MWIWNWWGRWGVTWQASAGISVVKDLEKTWAHCRTWQGTWREWTQKKPRCYWSFPLGLYWKNLPSAICENSGRCWSKEDVHLLEGQVREHLETLEYTSHGVWWDALKTAEGAAQCNCKAFLAYLGRIMTMGVIPMGWKKANITSQEIQERKSGETHDSETHLNHYNSDGADNPGNYFWLHERPEGDCV